MSSFQYQRRQQSYAKLKHIFQTVRTTLNPHLDVLTLAGLGVDISMVNMREETARGGLYYLPMSQGRLEGLDERPEFEPCFCMEDHQWNWSDGHALLRAFSQQVSRSKGDSLVYAYKSTKWCPKRRKSPVEKELGETGNGATSNPTRQYDWTLAGMFEADHLPHQTCMSLHFLPNVQGPFRSEMMIITGIMCAKLKRTRFRDQELLMLSIIGRDARIIQAHMRPDEQRLKLRYGQLVDLSRHTPLERDIFLRWLLSEPVMDTELSVDDEERPLSPAGDTAPRLSASPAPAPQNQRCREDMPKDFAGLSVGAIISVA